MNSVNKIIVGIDTRDLQIAKTGQRTVIEELCLEFKNSGDEHFKFIFFDSKFSVYTGKNKFLLLYEHIRYQCWKQVVLPLKAWQNNCDILFCGDYFSPYLRLGYKTIVIFHDAFFFEYKEHYNRIWLNIFRYTALPAARRCSYIMTVTNFARDKIQYYTRIPEEKFVTIYPGAKTLHTDINSLLIHDNLKIIIESKYILHIGVIEKRKNLPALIKAFKLLKENGHTGLKLVLVGGGNGKKYSDDTQQVNKTIHENSLEKDVITTGHLTDQQLGILYENAFMYVFPSINEGFGIPILEAFNFNLPVLVANNSSLPEVGGAAVLTFDPFNINDMYDKMKQVLEDEKLRMELKKKGRERVMQFSWEISAGKLLEVFKKAHNEGI